MPGEARLAEWGIQQQLELLESRVLLSGLTGSDVAGTWVFSGTAEAGTISFNDSGGITGGSLTTNTGNTVIIAGTYALI